MVISNLTEYSENKQVHGLNSMSSAKDDKDINKRERDKQEEPVTNKKQKLTEKLTLEDDTEKLTKETESTLKKKKGKNKVLKKILNQPLRRSPRKLAPEQARELTTDDLQTTTAEEKESAVNEHQEPVTAVNKQTTNKDQQEETTAQRATAVVAVNKQTTNEGLQEEKTEQENIATVAAVVVNDDTVNNSKLPEVAEQGREHKFLEKVSSLFKNHMDKMDYIKYKELCDSGLMQ